MPVTSRSRIVVRLGTADELSEAESVWRESVTARDRRPPSWEVIDAVRTVLRDAASQLFVAERDGRLVGIACATPARDEKGAATPGVTHIQMIFVRAEHWGRGIGGRLLDAVIDDARRRRMHAAQLWVLENNEAATRLYADRGFSHSGRVVEENGALIGLWMRSLGSSEEPG